MTYGLMKETLAAFSEKRKSLIPKRHMHCACSLWIYTEEMLCTLLCQHMKRCWLRREVCSHSKYSPLSSAWQQFTVGRCFSAHQAGKHDSMRARSLHGWAVERGLGGGDGAAATVQLVSAEQLMADWKQFEAMLLAAWWDLHYKIQEPLGV